MFHFLLHPCLSRHLNGWLSSTELFVFPSRSFLSSHQVTFTLAEAMWPAASTGCHSLLTGPGPGRCLLWSLSTLHPQLVQFQCRGQNILSPPVSHCILAKPWLARYFIHCPCAFSNRMLHNSPTSHLLLEWTVAHLWQHHTPAFLLASGTCFFSVFLSSPVHIEKPTFLLNSGSCLIGPLSLCPNSKSWLHN